MSAATLRHCAVSVTIAGAACLAAGLTGQPLALVAVALLPAIFVVAAKALERPFELVLLFVIFSFFRIHEVFLVLNPLRIPIMLALGTFSALAWNMFLRRTIEPYWSPELRVFLAFFVHVTIGIPFATDRPAAIAYWTSTFYKIAVMVFAIAWLMRKPKDFALLTMGMIISGLCVSGVALWNKANGIGLVEGTRVTISREIRSALGDPNDLSLVLLFPMAFGVAMCMTRGMRPFMRVLGALSVVTIAAAIIATQSRGGLLGMLAVWGVVANRYVKNKALLITGAVIGATVLAAVAGISSRQSGGAHEDGLDESAEGRIDAWGAATRMALAHPFVGVGIDNFIQNYFFYVSVWKGTVHAVHSTWFVVLAESGFVGIGLFLTILTMMVRCAVRALRLLDEMDAPAPARALSLALVSGLAGFCVSGTFLTQGFTWPFYIKLALVAAMNRYTLDFVAKRNASQPAAT